MCESVQPPPIQSPCLSGIFVSQLSKCGEDFFSNGCTTDYFKAGVTIPSLKKALTISRIQLTFPLTWHIYVAGRANIQQAGGRPQTPNMQFF